MNDKYSCAGKVAVVTGAGRGIGRASALAFGKAGARLAGLDLDLESAQETARLAGQGALALRCEVSLEPDTKAAVERWCRRSAPSS
jgi:NAD(P)-dependent dehydrogenase (short-subunit alcohol dehydrogenase family)